jgi:hypothetical protein
MILICGVACELSKFFCIVCIHTHWKPMDMKFKSIRHLKQIDNTFKVRRQSKHSGRLQCTYLLFDILFSILKIYAICDQLPYTLLHQLPSLYDQTLHHLHLALLWHRSHLYCLLDVGYLNTCCFCVANPMSSYSHLSLVSLDASKILIIITMFFACVVKHCHALSFC